MTAQTTDFSNLLYYNPAGPGFNPLVSATMTGPTSIDEGATATFNVVTWGIPDGPVYWWVTNLFNVTTDRITPGLVAEATITNNRSSFSVTVNANNATALQGAQTYDIAFGKVYGTPLASIMVLVNDTSQDPIGLMMDLDPKNYTTGSSISDASGYSHPGTLIGAPTFTTGGTNGDGNYFTLDGTSQYITVPSLLNSAYGSVTMSLWFNSSTGVGSLITKELSYKMRLNTGGSLAVLASSTGTGWQYNSTNILDTVSNDAWHHFAVSIGPDFVDWYLDGNRIQHEAGMGVDIHSSTRGVQIGGYDSIVPSELFTGKIGPARLYNYALTSQEVTDYYNATANRYQPRQSFGFNGTSQWIEVTGTTSDWALGTTWTIEYWSKASGVSPNAPKTVMSQYDNGSNRIDLYYQDGNLYINNGRSLCAEPTPGVWTHVALVCNGGGSLTVYYNGTSVYTGAGYNLGADSTTLAIGRRGPSNDFQYFSGKLTGIRITNTVVYTGTFDPYTVALPPIKITGTKLLMNPPNFSVFDDLSDSNHSFGNATQTAVDSDYPPHRYIARKYSVNTGYASNQGGNEISVLIADYPDIVNVPSGATVTWQGNTPNSITVVDPWTEAGIRRFGVSTLSFTAWGNDVLTFTW